MSKVLIVCPELEFGTRLRRVPHRSSSKFLKNQVPGTLSEPVAVALRDGDWIAPECLSMRSMTSTYMGGGPGPCRLLKGLQVGWVCELHFFTVFSLPWYEFRESHAE